MNRALTQLTVGVIGVICIAVVGGVGVAIILRGALEGTVPVPGPLTATASPDVLMPGSTTANPPSRAAAEDSPSPAAPSASAPTATAETRDSVPLRIDTPVARAWRDSAGTVRVHVVLSAINDTTDVLSLAAAERAFRLIGAEGRTVHSGRFAYAFPLVIPPGGTSYLITTAVLPVGVDETAVRVEATILADVATVVPPLLEVSGLRLVSSEGRPGVRGIVRNTGAEDVTFGIVAVIGRDEAGRVIGGLYDNVNVAFIPAGGEATFRTEYPGLPPAAAGQMTDLSGIAFDVGYQP